MGKAPVSNSDTQVSNENKSSSSASVGSSQKENGVEGFSHSLEISLVIISILAVIGICIAFRKKIGGFFKKQNKAKNDETLENVEAHDEIIEPKSEKDLDEMLQLDEELNEETEPEPNEPDNK